MIKGFVSPIDCFIRINVNFKKSKSIEDFFINNTELISTSIHEWTHYLQLISTPIGCEIRVRQQWLTAAAMALIVSASTQKPKNLQQLKKGIITEYEKNEHLRNNFIKHHKALTLFHKPIYNKNIPLFYEKCFPKNINNKYQYLRKTRPLEIDIEKKLIFLKDSGEHIKFSATTIMEQMARYLQQKHSGKMTSQEDVFNEILRKEYFHYNLPLLFMIQEGCLDDPLWHYQIHILLPIILQLSLLINPLILTSQIIKKHNIDRKNFLPEFLLSKCLFDPHNTTDYSYLLIQQMNDKQLNYKKYCNYILNNLSWPSVDEILSCFKQDILDNINLATNTSTANNNMIEDINKIPSKELSIGQYRKMQFYTFYHLCIHTWSNNKIIPDIFQLWDKAPTPIFFNTEEDGASFFPLESTFWNIRWELNGTLAMHIVQKLLSSNDLSCYNDPIGDTAIFKCPHLIECISIRNKKNLDFCKNLNWIKTVNQFIESTVSNLKPTL